MDKKLILYQLMGMLMNGIGSCCGMLTYLLGFSDCRELLLDTTHNGKGMPTNGLL